MTSSASNQLYLILKSHDTMFPHDGRDMTVGGSTDREVAFAEAERLNQFVAACRAFHGDLVEWMHSYHDSHPYPDPDSAPDGWDEWNMEYRRARARFIASSMMLTKPAEIQLVIEFDPLSPPSYRIQGVPQIVSEKVAA